MTTDKDTALRERMRKAIFAEAQFGVDRMTDAALVAIAEPAPVVRSHKCANGVTITYTEGAERPWHTTSGGSKWVTLSQACPYDLPDDDLAACLALKGQGEPCAWMNVMTSGVTPLFPSEKRARDAVVIAGHYTEIAVPLVRQSPAGQPMSAHTHCPRCHQPTQRDDAHTCAVQRGERE